MFLFQDWVSQRTDRDSFPAGAPLLLPRAAKAWGIHNTPSLNSQASGSFLHPTGSIRHVEKASNLLPSNWAGGHPRLTHSLIRTPSDSSSKHRQANPISPALQELTVQEREGEAEMETGRITTNDGGKDTDTQEHDGKLPDGTPGMWGWQAAGTIHNSLEITSYTTPASASEGKTFHLKLSARRGISSFVQFATKLRQPLTTGRNRNNGDSNEESRLVLLQLLARQTRPPPPTARAKQRGQGLSSGHLAQLVQA